MSVAVGLPVALASALALNWGYFAQHEAASSLPPLSLRRPLRSLAALVRARRWLAGLGAGLAGWALYVAALALAPLSLVQAASAGGIGLLALLVARTTGVRLGRDESSGVALAAAGLLLLGVSLAGRMPPPSHGSTGGAWLWVGGSLLAAAAAVAAPPRLLARGAGLGAAAGILYAAGDVATKASVVGGSRLLFVPAVLVCHGLAFVALQLGFQRGGALATAGVATLLTNAVPIVAGSVVFGEGIPGGPLGGVRVLSFALVVAGAAVLAGAAGRDSRPATAEPAGAPFRSPSGGGCKARAVPVEGEPEAA